jgi:hypothetical protein
MTSPNTNDGQDTSHLTEEIQAKVDAATAAKASTETEKTSEAAAAVSGVDSQHGGTHKVETGVEAGGAPDGLTQSEGHTSNSGDTDTDEGAESKGADK